jgi:hypothetical protein
MSVEMEYDDKTDSCKGNYIDVINSEEIIDDIAQQENEICYSENYNENMIVRVK